MQQGRGKVEPLAFSESLGNDSTLTQEQQQAIHLTCTTPDQFMAWQGSAGSGKTYALNTLKQIAQDQGYQVRGFAPSAEAAHGLGQALDIQTETVAALLASQNRETANAIWIVDEAGLLSMKDARALLSRATAEQARVILVGDTKQLSAVEAGNPFKSLQAGGITTAYLDETLRQQKQELKTAVQLIAQGKMIQGIDALDASGCIREVENADLRRKQLAQDYLALSPKERGQTLILAGTNQERLALTQTLRAELQTEASLGQDAFTVMGLRQKNITKTQAAYVTVYQPGDVLVPMQNYKKQGLLKGQQYTVVSVDRENHQLLVETSGGQVMSVEPGRCPLKSVYVGQEVQVAPGDQLRWTKNDRANKRRNGQRFTVQQIATDGIFQIIDNEGNSQQINLSGRQYVDYAWVSTTYGSQGKTADRVMALMDSTTTNRESFYVTVSRAKYHLELYTADKVALSQWAEVSKAKENTSDYVPLAQAVERKVARSPANHHNTSSIAKQPVATTITTELSEPEQYVIPHRSPYPRINQFRTEPPPPESDTQQSAKQKYINLWQQYSQGLKVSDPVNLDLQVARRALTDGQAQKDIALMISAGSAMVRRIVHDQGKPSAMLYVNQTVKKLLSCQKIDKVTDLNTLKQTKCLEVDI
nr:AAA family ATPase [Adonisia turfae]